MTTYQSVQRIQASIVDHRKRWPDSAGYFHYSAAPSETSSFQTGVAGFPEMADLWRGFLGALVEISAVRLMYYCLALQAALSPETPPSVINTGTPPGMRFARLLRLFIPFLPEMRISGRVPTEHR